MTPQNTTGVHGGNGISPATGSFDAHASTSQKKAIANPVFTISMGEVKLSVFAPARPTIKSEHAEWALPHSWRVDVFIFITIVNEGADRNSW